MIEVAKAGATIAACPHSLEAKKLSSIRHHFKRVAGGWQYHVAIACHDCEDKIPYPVGGNETAIDAAVDRVCDKQITLNCDLYLLDDGTIITYHERASDDNASFHPTEQQVTQLQGGRLSSVKEASR